MYDEHGMSNIFLLESWNPGILESWNPGILDPLDVTYICVSEKRSLLDMGSIII